MRRAVLLHHEEVGAGADVVGGEREIGCWDDGELAPRGTEIDLQGSASNAWLRRRIPVQPVHDSEAKPIFATTRWSVVLAAGQANTPAAAQALDQLCRSYWYPLYAYARRRGCKAHDAEDLVQGFFGRMVAKDLLRGLDRDSGRFRSFLLTCFNRFLGDEHDRARRLKRGGGRELLSLDTKSAEDRYRLEPADMLDPEKIFERRWALTLLEHVLTRLRTDLDAQGKGQLFKHLQALVVRETGAAKQSEVAARLGLSEGAVAVAVHRLRQSYRRLLRETIAQTVERPEDVDDELRHLLAVLRA